MRKVITYLLFAIPVCSNGQEGNKLSVMIHVQPEITFYNSNYSYRWRDPYLEASFCVGGGVALQYNISRRIFADIGVGYIPRRLQTQVFFNQGAIPPPRQSFTQELVISKDVSMRMIVLPFNVGYRFKRKENTTWFINAGVAGNYLLNTDYNMKGRYAGSYKKHEWQGISIIFGGGFDQEIKKNIFITGKAGYSMINTMRIDPYLSSQDHYGVALSHTFLDLSVGVKIPFHGLKHVSK
jgi:hypothetical protein